MAGTTNNPYHSLSLELVSRIEQDRKNGYVNPLATKDEDIVRRFPTHDRANLWRPAFVRDIEKIMYLPLYNRYADKTQVFSFYENDDITRRAQHIQMVSRIARNIGSVLGLNLDLIEAISLGHDLGHTPFGHAGERCLEKELSSHTGGKYHFMHNIQSARVLDHMFLRNVSVQVLDGIICHNGEAELPVYVPTPGLSFASFDRNMNACLGDLKENKRLCAGTLEGCVMRISDIIAYVGKDRDDARLTGILSGGEAFSETPEIGSDTSQMINNLIVDVIENSYGKDSICLSEGAFGALSRAKKDNYELIYKDPKVDCMFRNTIGPMFTSLYEKLLSDLEHHQENSVIYTHHLAYLSEQTTYYRTYQKERFEEYLASDPNLIVMDYIASMTDDYFLELYKHLFPSDNTTVSYIGYFK